MCMLTKRTNILFDEKLWEELVELSKRTGTSIGQLVRTAVEDKYDEERKLARRAKTIEEILALKAEYQKKHKKKSKNKEGIVSLVKRMREERTQHLLSIVEKKS